MTIKLEDWQQRVVDEASELTKKCIALEAFLETETYKAFGIYEQAKLTTQAYFMTMYLVVLEDRIISFTDGGQDDN